MHTLAAAVLFALLSVDVPTQPPELGRVKFGRELDAGLGAARSAAKPAFLLFQEIPGCQTCRDFGGGPLSHPLLVEAIETCFVPIAIHNNKGGADADALKRFGEPAWNNPVVRFVDGDGKDLIPRRDGAWSAGEVAERMVAALAAAKRDVPRWLELARLELRPTDPQRVVFTMHCFWEGQQKLGGLDGVIDSRPGFLDGREVVDVRFDASRIELGELARRASEMECATAIHVARGSDRDRLPTELRERARVLDGDVRAAGADDDLRRLKRVRELDLLPLTRTQAIRVNSELAATNKTRPGTLTPRQEALRARIVAAKPDALVGLARPTTSASLGAHEDALRARLGP